MLPTQVGHELLWLLPRKQQEAIRKDNLPVFACVAQGSTLKFKCPQCKRLHHHGMAGTEAGFGHRSAHCVEGYESGYYILNPSIFVALDNKPTDKAFPLKAVKDFVDALKTIKGIVSSDVNRSLSITINRNAYGSTSSVLIEMQGSPVKTQLLFKVPFCVGSDFILNGDKFGYHPGKRDKGYAPDKNNVTHTTVAKAIIDLTLYTALGKALQESGKRGAAPLFFFLTCLDSAP